jgi:hypothetical protein
MSHFYDRSGRPIALERWAQLMEDPEYRIVDQTLVNGRWQVSTVWLGLDHAWWGPPPVIFETTVSDHTGKNSLARHHEWECRRYSTEADARRGHDEMVSLVEALDYAELHEDSQRSDQ